MDRRAGFSRANCAPPIQLWGQKGAPALQREMVTGSYLVVKRTQAVAQIRDQHSQANF
jgi:hypothetical protein